MFLVTFWHGLRASEVVALTPHNFHDHHITVERLKGSLRTTHALVADDEPLLNELRGVSEFLPNCAPNQRLFKITRQHFWRLFRAYSEQAGIPEHKRHPHVLKHTVAMQAIHSAGIENVRQHLGHKSISSTGEYLRVTDESASAAVIGAVRKLKN